MSMTKDWIIQILAFLEHSDARVESFANAVTSALEGEPIVGTSPTWDLGRDGRSPRAGRHTFVFTTLREDVAKISADATRHLEKEKKTTKLYIFTSQPASDHKLKDFENEAEAILGSDANPKALGARQIADLFEPDGPLPESLFLRFYGGEVDGLRTTFTPAAEGTPIASLQLALCTFGASDSEQLRAALRRQVILSLLQNAPLTPGELASKATARFGFSSFDGTVLAHFCRGMMEEGLLDDAGTRFAITTEGQRILAESKAGAVKAAVEGSAAVRRSIEQSLGTALSDVQWANIWKSVQLEISDLFYIKGRDLLETVAAFSEGTARQEIRESLVEMLERALDRVAEKEASGPQRSLMRQALHDAFLSENPGGGFLWLSQVAASYACLCTLALAPEVYRAVEQALKKYVSSWIQTPLLPTSALTTWGTKLPSCCSILAPAFRSRS